MGLTANDSAHYVEFMKDLKKQCEMYNVTTQRQAIAYLADCLYGEE